MAACHGLAGQEVKKSPARRRPYNLFLSVENDIHIMIDERAVKELIASLLRKYDKLKSGDESEKRSEEFIRTLFEPLGWEWLSENVVPQKRGRGALTTTRVDYQFKKNGEVRPSFYVEVKRFSNKLDSPDDRKQALDY